MTWINNFNGKFGMKNKLIGYLKRPQKHIWTLNDYCGNRHRVLILRKTGGLGDIFMHRMIFEDFKILYPEIHVTFACPKKFHQAVEDHPFIDEIIDYNDVDQNKFYNSYDTTTVCGMTEMTYAPISAPNRSDIWAGHCGVELTRHNMHFRISKEENEQAINQLSKYPRPIIGIAPISAISGKNLETKQYQPVVEGLKKHGCTPIGFHSGSIPEFNAAQIAGKNIRNFIALVNNIDCMISVDTAGFHLAGGLGKPLVGIFGWTDGKVYGKYYKNWELVQRHRDNGDWDCGPCYMWGNCPKCTENRKPCIDGITAEEILEAFIKLRKTV